MEKRIAIYSRKSKFTGTGESIDNQIELCRKYIETLLTEKSIVIFEDEGFSGGNTKRPQFKAMMEAAERRELSAIVCYRLDRISRNTGDFAKLIERLEELGVAFISIKEKFDTSSPMGRAMMYISSVFSQLERETIAERIKDNMIELAKTGRWLGGRAPLGYRSETIEEISLEGKTKRQACLVIKEDESEWVRDIYDIYIDCKNLTESVYEVNSRGIRTGNGKEHTRFSLRKILTNPLYVQADKDIYDYFENIGAIPFCGRELFDGKTAVMVFNRTLQRKGKATRVKRPCEWIVTVGKHKAIINSGKWLAVQDKINKTK